MGQSPSSSSGDPNALIPSAEKVFRGTVLRIEQVKNSDLATVLVTLRVDEALRGCHAGETIAIREWAGLWVKGDRYRAGQQLSLRLYPPSDLGLTSTVAAEIVSSPIPSRDTVKLTTSQPSPSSQPGARPTYGESQSTRSGLRSIPTKTRQIQAEAAE